MSNNKKIIFISVVLFAIGYWLLAISVSTAETPTLKYEFPCTSIAGGTCSPDSATSPAAYIARFYQFALMIAGILAFGMLLWGAIKYTVSRGNAGQIEDAKDIIYQALWGVALLLGAFLILYTIDPGLVNLRDPNITSLIPASPSNTSVPSGLTEQEKTTATKNFSEMSLDELRNGLQSIVAAEKEDIKEQNKILDDLKQGLISNDVYTQKFKTLYESRLEKVQKEGLITNEIVKREKAAGQK
jgi:hypothetical protein